MLACGPSLDGLGRCRRCKKLPSEHPQQRTEDWLSQLKAGAFADSLILYDVDYPNNCEHLKVLADNKTLTQLHIHGSKGMLDKVKLYHIQQFAERETFFGSLFKNNRTLTDVCLRVGLEGSRIASSLSKLPLVKLDLSNNAIALKGMNALRVLSRCPKLAELSLRQNMIYPSSAPALCDLVRNLTHLDLGHNKLGPKGLAGLAPAIKTALNLRTLNLEHNVLGSALLPLADALSRHPLRYLNLAFNDILDEGAEFVSKIIANSSGLQELILDDNYIGPTGALSLMPTLTLCPSLTRLSMAWNAMGIGGLGRGLKAIGDMLAFNKSLTSLNLCDNGIGPSGCADIFRELATNPETGLRTLDMSINPIECEGAIAVANYISSPACKLTYLDLDRCSIGTEGAAALAKALPLNSTLCWLNMAKNQFGSQAGEALMAVWETHASLLDLTLPDPTIKSEQDRDFRISYQIARRNQLARSVSTATLLPMVLTRLAADFLETPIVLDISFVLPPLDFKDAEELKTEDGSTVDENIPETSLEEAPSEPAFLVVPSSPSASSVCTSSPESVLAT